MKITLFALSCLTLVACSMGYAPRMYYSYIEVANHTGTTITNVELQIGVDDRNLRCDTVTKNSICEERFGKRRYPREIIELSWQDSAGQPQTRQLDPVLSVHLSPTFGMKILLKIKEDGSVTVDIRQDETFSKCIYP
jgi:hypothetical protein